MKWYEYVKLSAESKVLEVGKPDFVLTNTAEGNKCEVCGWHTDKASCAVDGYPYLTFVKTIAGIEPVKPKPVEVVPEELEAPK